MVLLENDDYLCAEFKAYLNRCFCIKHLGPLKYFLGIEVACNEKDLFLCERKYAIEILDECRLFGAKSADFLMETNHKLGLATRKLLEILLNVVA